MTQRLQSYLGYSYPSQLTDLVRKVWPEESLLGLPSDGLLRQILDTAYHATLLREETRPITFRLILINPEQLPCNGAPPHGLMPLIFERPRTFNEQEIRRLALAADFYRSLIGVGYDEKGELRIWGVTVSGTRWVNAIDGGRYIGAPMPGALIIYGRAPGRLTVYHGPERIATLSNGQIEAQSFDIFSSGWLPKAWDHARYAFLERIFGSANDIASVPIDSGFIGTISQNVLRRTLSQVRNAKHGGTLVFVNAELESQFRCEQSPIDFKYIFQPNSARQRYTATIRRAMVRLNELTRDDPGRLISWHEYQTIRDPDLSDLNEELFEYAHFLADLMSVDGALILNKFFEVIGFGAELRVKAPELTSVRHALDTEGSIWSNESLHEVGTRHRAVYRFCHRYRDCLAIVVSQDGSIRWVRNKDGEVIYWNQLSW
jgi:Probable sensor domain DACNV